MTWNYCKSVIVEIAESLTLHFQRPLFRLRREQKPFNSRRSAGFYRQSRVRRIKITYSPQTQLSEAIDESGSLLLLMNHGVRVVLSVMKPE